MSQKESTYFDKAIRLNTNKNYILEEEFIFNHQMWLMEKLHHSISFYFCYIRFPVTSMRPKTNLRIELLATPSISFLSHFLRSVERNTLFVDFWNTQESCLPGSMHLGALLTL